MSEITQRVKYVVSVDTTELDAFKAKLDGVNALLGSFAVTMRSVTDAGRANVANLAKVNTELATVAKTQKAVTAGFKESEGAGRAAGMTWLRAFGVFQSARFAVGQLFDTIKKGAENIDLENVLGRQVEGFADTIEKAQARTAGVVSRGNLTRSFALMSSFGIPMDKFAENMELVQKMAVRTGQSADFLSESFARGISRLSPLILDNLGIQVSLGDANKAYANSTGQLVTELTKEEKIAALLAQVLGKLEGATKGVDLQTGSLAATMARGKAAWDNFRDGISGGAAIAVGELDAALESASTTVGRFVANADMKEDIFRPVANFTRAMGGDASALEAAARAYESMGVSLKLMASNETLADLFGNNGLAGTNISQVAAVLQVQNDAFESLNNQIGISVQELGNWKAALSIGGANEGPLVTGGIFAIMREATEATSGTLDELLVKYKGILSAQEILNLRKEQEAKTSAHVNMLVHNAMVLSQTTGIPLSNVLVQMYRRQADALEEQAAAVEATVDRMVEQARLNAGLEASQKLQLQDNDIMLANSERMFQLVEGTMLSEIELNRVQEERTFVQRQIDDLQKQYLETQDQTTLGEILLKQEEMIRLDIARETAQTKMEGEKAWIETAKAGTKAQIKLDLARLDALIELMKVMKANVSNLGGDATTISEGIQNMLNARKEIASALKRTGGGGRKDDDFFAFKRQGRLGKPTIYGWNMEDLADAKGEILALREALSIGGEVRGGFGGMSSFFGSMSPEEIAASREQLDLLDRIRNAAVSRFGADNIGFLEMFGPPGEDRAFRERLKAMEDHMQRLVDFADGLNKLAFAMDNVAGGFQTLYGDLVGEDVQNFFTQFTGSINMMSEALRNNADAYELTTAAIPVIRSFTQNLIKNREAQAGVEAIMQGAAAWAAFAIGNIPAGIMHSTAALMYAGVAGGILRLPKGKPKGDSLKDSNSTSTARYRDVHVHFDRDIGITTEAERGMIVREMLRAADRAGM